MINELLNIFFEKLYSRNIKYCVLHSYDLIPDQIESDIDITIEYNKIQEIEEIFEEIENEIGWKVVQKLRHEYCAYYYVLITYDNNQLYTVQLDFNTDYVRDGRICLKNIDLISNTRKYKNFYILNEEYEFIYLIMKKILKEFFKEKQKNKLLDLYNIKTDSINEMLKNYFSKDSIIIFQQGLSADFSIIETNNKRLKEDLLNNLRKKDRLGTYKYKILNFNRKIMRIFNPTGCMIVLQGPDGVGKTSVANVLINNFHDTFRKTAYYHLKPSLKAKGNPTNGSDEIKYVFDFKYKPTLKDKIMSYIKVFYNFIFCYTILYYFRIAKEKIKSTFIIFDRYSMDYYIFPEAKRYYSTLKLPFMLSRIVPKSDLIFYLDCSPEEVLKRKKELPIDQIILQQERSMRLLKRFNNCYYINAEKSIEEVSKDISIEVISYLNKRYKEKFKENRK
ncbi:hypothetical protein [Clostridium sp.]|uniref:hypothetical protein n=1 Tax=Clostridium sp. TaxID=1506 RepID=UPI003D6D245A